MAAIIKYSLMYVLFLQAWVMGQTVYTGTIGKAKVEFVVENIYDKDNVEGVYIYKKYNNPIPLSGILQKGVLTLKEKNSELLVFKNYSSQNKNVNGVWKNWETKKELPITLVRAYDFNTDRNDIWADRELLQIHASETYSFRLILSKTESNGVYIAGIKIFDWSKGKHLQTIETECQYFQGLKSIEVNDYNFDGIMDFSVYREAFAGGNTSSRYFLYDAEANAFFDSEFKGVNLFFNSDTKTVEENYQTRGGRYSYSAVYSIENNQMILQKEDCTENGNDGTSQQEDGCK